MKRKIFSLILIVALLLTAAVLGTNSLASEETAAEIKYQNLSYRSNVNVKYAVEVTGLPDGAEVGIRVAKGSPDSATVIEATLDGGQNINGKPHYIFNFAGLSASDMTVNLYATPYVTLDGEEIYTGATKKSSVLEYSYKILGKIEGGTTVSDSVKELIEAMLDYGATVQVYGKKNLDRLANAEYNLISVAGGSFADGFDTGLYQSGESITLVADDNEWSEFTSWKDSSGNVVSGDATATLSAPAGSEIYVATYETHNISYELNGGTLEGGDRGDYEEGTAFTLPIPTRSGYVFSGWFTSADFDISTIITEIPSTATGNYKLYAKWNKIISDLDSDGLLNCGKTKGQEASYAVQDGRLEWTAASVATELVGNGSISAGLDGEKSFTINLTLSKVEGYSASSANFRIRRGKLEGEASAPNRYVIFMRVNTDGSVSLGNGDVPLGYLTEEEQTFKIFFDFENKQIVAYSENGAEIASVNLVIPSEDKVTYDEWLAALTSQLWRIWTDPNDGKIAISRISVHAGNSAIRTDGDGYTEEERAEMIADLKADIAAQRGELASFVKTEVSTYSGSSATYKDVSIFTGATEDITSLLTEGDIDWGTAPTTPIAEHPRLLFTESDKPAILAALEENTGSNALFNSYVNMPVTGMLASPGSFTLGSTEQVSNYNATVLEMILAKALAYQLYDNEYYGYQAIYAIKNYLKTLEIHYIASDQYHQYGHTMFVTACVYDWCYDLLDTTDKAQLIAGVENALCRGRNYSGVKMEVGFPPKKQGSVSGHGSEYQILRDYLSFSLAIYDENASWWDYTGARFYNDYVVSRNGYYVSGIYSQGTSYVGVRHTSSLFSAWIVEVGTKAGENPYVNMEKTVRSYIGYEFAPGLIFSDGDSSVNAKTTVLRDHTFLAAMLFDDATMLAQGEYLLGSGRYGASAQGLTNVLYIILRGRLDVEPTEDRYEGLDLIQYNGAPLGQYVIREAWGDADSAAVFMKLKERSAGNHEHDDAGTFQIYYKGLLSGDSGVYNSYPHYHTQYFHQATIAHNGLLIFDESKWSTASGATDAQKWYSGSQRRMSEISTYEGWLADTDFDTGVITGRQHGYSDGASTKPLYAYLAGDITAAYDQTTVDYVGRRMLTVYTGNEDFPMAFFVYDDVESDEASYVKKFLLQINSKNAPTIDENAMTITTENGSGRLVLHSLSDGVTFSPQGGRAYDANGKYDADNSKNYLVNGVNCKTLDGKDDGHWGRVEIVASEATVAQFMNVLYVTDAGQTKTAPTVSKLSGEGFVGGVFGDVAAIFSTSRERSYAPISTTVSGTGTVKYYVSGLGAGNWSVTVDGVSYGTYEVTEEGGLLTFEAPAGTVRIAPEEKHITYNLGIGELPEDAPTVYEPGRTVTLPTPTPTVGYEGSIFCGWYTTSTFEESSKVTEVPRDAFDGFTVYAKWNVAIFFEDYSSANIDTVANGNKAQTVNGIKYSSSNLTNASCKTGIDSNGNKYVEASATNSAGVQIMASGNLKGALNGSKQVSFVLKLAKNPDNTAVLPLAFRLRHGASGNKYSTFLNLNSSGKILLGKGTSPTVATLSNDGSFTTVRVVADFSDSTGTKINLTAYGEDGNVIATTTVAIPTDVYSTVEDFYNNLTGSYFDCQAYLGNGSVRIGQISMYVGNIFE